MRWDMFKVIVERPRGGGGTGRWQARAKQQARQDLEHAPLQQPIGRGRGTKHLRENLAPLRRYLLGQVGRPWDAVHAEISANLRLTSTVQRHVLEHLEQMVVRHVALVDRRPTFAVNHEPVVAGRWRNVVYVCPVTGKLRAVLRSQRSPPPPSPSRIDLPDGSQLQRIAGVWHHLTLLPLPPRRGDREGLWDVVLRVRLDVRDTYAMYRQLKEQYGREAVYAGARQQPGKRALARLLAEGRR